MKLKKRIQRITYWVRRRSYLAALLVGAFVVVLLFFNDETSISKNIEYQKEINRLKTEIKEANDSAQYYREKRSAVLAGRDELEHLAREKFNMQKPTEEVYIIK